jgi:hypothetical protein
VDEGRKRSSRSREGLGLENDTSAFDCLVDGREIKEEKERCTRLWVKMYEGLRRVKDRAGILEVGATAWGKWKHTRPVFD